MVRGVRTSLKSDRNGYTFTLKLSNSLKTQKDNVPHTKPSMDNEHFHNEPRHETGDTIVKQSDLPNCIYLDTWVYKEYALGLIVTAVSAVADAAAPAAIGIGTLGGLAYGGWAISDSVP